jgi:hypothetical protein
LGFENLARLGMRKRLWSISQQRRGGMGYLSFPS